jgi:hypothetical protein
MAAIRHSRRDCVDSLNYDVVGVGVGATAALEDGKNWVHETKPPENPLDSTVVTRGYIEVIPVNSGVTASDALWPDNKRSVEKFANLRAEMWWVMRDRFLKTFEYVLFLKGEEGGVEHPLDELIVMPDDHALQTQLSLPTWDRTATGKVLIESKRSMQNRGVKSPDYADALAFTFVPPELAGDFEVMREGYV